MVTYMRTYINVAKECQWYCSNWTKLRTVPDSRGSVGYEGGWDMKKAENDEVICEKIAPPDKNKHSRDDINSESRSRVCKRKKGRAAIVVMAVTMRSWVLSTRIFLPKLCMTVFFFPRVS